MQDGCQLSQKLQEHLEARDSSSASVRPMCGTPPRIAMVAGVAPCWRTTSSTALAVSRFCTHVPADIAEKASRMRQQQAGVAKRCCGRRLLVHGAKIVSERFLLSHSPQNILRWIVEAQWPLCGHFHARVRRADLANGRACAACTQAMPQARTRSARGLGIAEAGQAPPVGMACHG